MWLLKKFVYRIVHLSLLLSAKLLTFKEPECITGANAVKKLPAAVKARGIRNVLIITGNTVRKMPQFADLLSGLGDLGIKYTVFSNLQANPTIQNIEDARETYLLNRCEGIIAFGGGSPIDCAKVAAARVTNKKTVKQMKGLFKVRKALPPLFAVPTTAGTGSEVTIAAVVTDPAAQMKFGIADPKLVPVAAILDPCVMAGLPPAITAATGMDALTHAVEAYVGRSGTAETDAHAERAVKLIFQHLETAYADGSNLYAREQMAFASYYAGAAFTKASVGYVHAIAHKLGGLYGTAHGLANAVILPYVLEYYGASAERKLAKLARLTGIASETESRHHAAVKFIDYVKSMNRRMGIPDHLAEIKKEDIPAIADSAVREGNPFYPVPKIINQAECSEIIAQLITR